MNNKEIIQDEVLLLLGNDSYPIVRELAKARGYTNLHKLFKDINVRSDTFNKGNIRMVDFKKLSKIFNISVVELGVLMIESKEEYKSLSRYEREVINNVIKRSRYEQKGL